MNVHASRTTRKRIKHCFICHEPVKPAGPNRAKGEIYERRLVHRRCIPRLKLQPYLIYTAKR